MEAVAKKRGSKVVLPDLRTQKRIVVILVVTVFAFIVLVGRLFWVQIISGERYFSMAQDQWMRKSSITPWRGSILDTRGEVLAESVISEKLVFHPMLIKKADEVATSLSGILGIPRDKLMQMATRKGTYEVLVKRQLTEKQSQDVQEIIDKNKLIGLQLVTDNIRVYKDQSLLSKVLGYTSVDGAGQEGLELKYDKYLKGEPGQIVGISDSKGFQLPESNTTYVGAKNGQNLQLTVDANIQHFTEQALDEAVAQYKPKYAGAIVMDVNTGAILAMAAKPDYNLNQPPRKDLTLLRSLSRNQLIQDNYDPGSTFKVITTAAALQENVVAPSSTFTCNKGRNIDGTLIRCWKRDGSHGTQDLAMAVRNSCNPAFMDMALRMGKDRFYKYVYGFGFGQQTGIDFNGEEKGIVTQVRYVNRIDLACMAFGQSISVTPIQLISAFSAVVNGGTMVQPHLVSAIVNDQGNTVSRFTPPAQKRIIDPQVSATMRDILEFTVRDGVKSAYIPGYRVGGKTGTAQKYQNGQILEGKHVSSFIGFAPADKPRFAVLVIVDEPQTAVDFGSVVAAPYAKKIMASTLLYLRVTKGVLPGEDEVIRQVKVPSVIGKTTQDAQSVLRAAGLESIFSGTGVVMTQNPAPGEMIINRSPVLMTTSREYPLDTSEEVVVPDVTGLSIVEALGKLSQQGLVLKVRGSGIAKQQSPAAGQTVRKGSQVTIEFS